MKPVARVVYATAPRGARALRAQELARRYGSRSFDRLANALAVARSESKARDIVCVTGSLALVGEARDLLGLPVAERLWANDVAVSGD
jgi:folylpolyglutamate synthase/dihydropteroate synthase